MAVSLILVTYNRSDRLKKLLESLSLFSWEYDHFLIIDNCSTDSTKSVIDMFKISLNIDYIFNKINLGHGAAIGIGLKKLKEKLIQPSYIVFLEDDSIPQAGYLDLLIKTISMNGFSLISSGGYKVKLGRRIKIRPKKNQILEAEFGLLDGAIAKFDDLIKVGYPVEDWFMMFDDFEYCYRIRNAGYKIGVVNNPYVEILHDGWGGGASHSHLWRSYYQSRNFIHFVRIHFSAFNLIDCIILQSKRLIGGLLAKNGWITTKMRLKGIRAGLLGKKGKSLDLMTLKEI